MFKCPALQEMFIDPKIVVMDYGIKPKLKSQLAKDKDFISEDKSGKSKFSKKLSEALVQDD